MSDSDHDGDIGTGDDVGPTIEVIYPVGEETEVPQTNGQLFKTVITEGKGSRPVTGAKVTVHYTGTLDSDGSKFDSSRDRGEYFDFVLGKGQVIKGWDKGVATMRKGERANLKCFAEFAYGARGSPPKIPGGATLNFDVELIDWTKSEDVSEFKDRSVLKGIRTEGKGWGTPGYESEVKGTITILAEAVGEDDGSVITAERPFTWAVGEFSNGVEFPDGVEQALKSFKKGEVSSIDVRASAVPRDVPSFGIKAGIPYRAIVKVDDFTSANVYDFEGAAKIAEGARRKEAGNAHFVAQRWQYAIQKYKRALEFVENDYGLEEADKEAAIKIRIPTYTNLAQAYINVGNFDEAVSACTKCLEFDANNIKALFRRGRANNAKNEWEAAKGDLKRALELDPSNADVQREWALVAEKERKQKAADKARYGNMFAKMAAMEEKEQQR